MDPLEKQGRVYADQIDHPGLRKALHDLFDAIKEKGETVATLRAQLAERDEQLRVHRQTTGCLYGMDPGQESCTEPAACCVKHHQQALDQLRAAQLAVRVADKARAEVGEQLRRVRELEHDWNGNADLMRLDDVARELRRALSDAGEGRERFTTHYDTLPHGNCNDPERCDCQCVGCMNAWREAGEPGPCKVKDCDRPECRPGDDGGECDCSVTLGVLCKKCLGRR